MKTKRTYLIGGVAVAIAFGVLLFRAFGTFGSYSLTVTQFKDMQASQGMHIGELKQALAISGDKDMQLHGWIAANASQSELLITDGTLSLPIAYTGSLARSLTPGTEVVVWGFSENGSFIAKKLNTTKEVRIEGPLAPEVEVTYDVVTRTTRFTITDAEDFSGPKQVLPVVYTGAVPDTFFIDVKKVDVSMVVVGRMGADGIFIASQILTKCASRYEAATPTPQSGGT